MREGFRILFVSHSFFYHQNIIKRFMILHPEMFKDGPQGCDCFLHKKGAGSFKYLMVKELRKWILLNQNDLCFILRVNFLTASVVEHSTGWLVPNLSLSSQLKWHFLRRGVALGTAKSSPLD